MSPHGGANAQDGEVARAAAEVANQNQFVVTEPLLVAVCGGDRLVFKDDFGETAALDRRIQARDGEVIVSFDAGVREMDGPSRHQLSRQLRERAERSGEEMMQDEGDQVLEGV